MALSSCLTIVASGAVSLEWEAKLEGRSVWKMWWAFGKVGDRWLVFCIEAWIVGVETSMLLRFVVKVLANCGSYPHLLFHDRVDVFV